MVTVCASQLTGCAVAPRAGQSSFRDTFASDDPCSNNGRNIGIAVGAIAGAVIGNQVKHSNSARLVGAGLGALAGGVIGADFDCRRCELARIARQHNLDMQVEEIKSAQLDAPGDASEGMRVSLRDSSMQFVSGSDALTPTAQVYFRQIADQYSWEQQRRRLVPGASRDEVAAVESLKGKRILLIGHTDDSGNSALNADLSERRARSVARLFHERGIAEEQLFFQGAGETLPIADNRSESGRSRNRRVEILDMADEGRLRAYLQQRKPVLAYYRNNGSYRVDAPVASGIDASHATPARPGPGATPAVDTRPAGGPVAASQRQAVPKVAAASPAKRKPAADGGPAPTAPASGALDFGGAPVGMNPVPVDVGRVPVAAAGGLIPSAHADEPLAGSCTQDRPRIANGVKSLRDGREFSTGDYLPGLYGTSWVAQVNGHMVALTNVAILRDGGAPARRPQLLVYRDYRGDTSARPAWSSAPEVNAYRGDKAVLVRVFVGGPVRCMDLLIPNNQPSEARQSALYYQRGPALYVAPYPARLAKS